MNFTNRSRNGCSGNTHCNLLLGLKHYDPELGYFGFDNSYTPGVPGVTSKNVDLSKRQHNIDIQLFR